MNYNFEWDKNMKKEYDFSKGVRENFYKEDANFNMPIYLDSEIQLFIAKITKEQQTTMRKNNWQIVH